MKNRIDFKRILYIIKLNKIQKADSVLSYVPTSIHVCFLRASFHSPINWLNRNYSFSSPSLLPYVDKMAQLLQPSTFLLCRCSPSLIHLPYHLHPVHHYLLWL